jgi:hypothetical protein
VVGSGATPPTDLISPFNVVSTADRWLDLARSNGTE